MKILPAIDLMGGKAVRLLQGDYSRKTVYSDDPLALAVQFQTAGARYLHLVDLDGAREGSTPNFSVIASIIAAGSLNAEVGGGIRDMGTREKYLAAGAWRVILGTAALNDKAFLGEALRRYAAHVTVGVDIKDGFVAVKGWTEVTELPLDPFVTQLSDLGVTNIICTDISRDGAMRGTNRALYSRLMLRHNILITASGGVSTLDDIQALKKIGVDGVIIGKALYTGDIVLGSAIQLAQEEGNGDG